MKTRIITIATACIMLTSFSVFANSNMNPLKTLSSANIIRVYSDAITDGNVDFNKFLFSGDFEYHNTANDSKYGRMAYTNFLKKNKGLKFNCKTSYEMLDECGKACVAKTTMEFDTFTRVDYITLNRGQDGWKISKVVTTYP